MGGGISGLAAAHELTRCGLEVVVLEASDRLGGAIDTQRTDGWIVERGANTVVDRDPLTKLASELGLEPTTAAPESSARFVWYEGELHTLPRDPLSFLRSSLLPLGAKIKILAEPLASPPPEHDESIADLVRRRLGPEILERLVAPFVAGIYAGDPELLSVRHALPRLARLEAEHGSLIRGAFREPRRPRPRPISFHEGLAPLPSAVAPAIADVRLTTPAEGIARRGDLLAVRTRNDEITAPRIVVATPARVTARVLSDLSGGVSEALGELPHSGVVVLALGFRRRDVDDELDGFGFLSAEPDFPLLGCLYSSTLFPDSAPDDRVLLTAFLGGARRPDALDREDGELVDSAVSALDRVLGIRGDPVFETLRRWRPGIPQYEIGHRRFLDLVEAIESEVPGLVIVGNYLRGVAVPDCIATARWKVRERLVDES